MSRKALDTNRERKAVTDTVQEELAPKAKTPKKVEVPYKVGRKVLITYNGEDFVATAEPSVTI